MVRQRVSDDGPGTATDGDGHLGPELIVNQVVVPEEIVGVAGHFRCCWGRSGCCRPLNL